MSFQLSIAEIKQGAYHHLSQRLYVIEGEGCVLYVGQSKCAITRMESHLGLGPWRNFFGSSIDMVLTKNRNADHYTVTFYDDTDIAALSQQIGYDVDVSDVESKLIFELSPVFNAQGKKKHADNIQRWYSLHPPEAITVDAFLEQQR